MLVQTRTKLGILTLSGALSFAWGCGDSDETCSLGEYQCECSAEGSCLGDLECIQGVCLMVGEEESTGDEVSSDEVGDGDGDGGDGDTGDGDGDSICEQADPGWSAPFAVGEGVKHIPGYDAVDSLRNVCELGGKPIVLNVDSMWSPPGQNVANYMSGASDISPGTGWPEVRELVNAGTINWVTILIENGSNEPATPQDVADWSTTYSSEMMMNISDADMQVPTYTALMGIPHILVIDDQFRWEYIDGGLGIEYVANTYGP